MNPNKTMMIEVDTFNRLCEERQQLREFIELILADGRLQTSQDRERCRRQGRALLHRTRTQEG